MNGTWKRSDVALGDLFTRDNLRDSEPLIYRVVGLIDEPVAVLRPMLERDGEDDEHFVISSPLFAEYSKVESRVPA